METTSPVKSLPLPKRTIFIAAGAIIFFLAVIIGVSLFFMRSKDTNTSTSGNSTDEETNEGAGEETETPTTDDRINGEFLASGKCPDSLTTGTDGNLRAVIDGKEYFVRGEDMAYVDANCREQPGTEAKGPQFVSPECTGEGTVTYTKPLIAVADLGNITPLGRMFDSHVTPTDHQYWQPKDSGASWTKYAIYAPADGHIITVGRTLPGKSTTTDMSATISGTEYRIVIEHSCDHATILTHMHDLSKSILSQLTFDSNNNATGTFRIPVKAGEEIARVGGSSFDVTTVDQNVTLTGFITPELYEGEPWKIHTVDSLDYFSESLKSQYTAKTSRSVKPIGGKIDYDVKGKLVGNWFREGSDYSEDHVTRYWDGHLTFAYNPHDGKTVMVSTGHFLGEKSAQFIVAGNTPDPATVDKSDGIVVYKLYDYQYTTSSGAGWNAQTVEKNVKISTKGSVKATLLVQVLDGEKIKVQIVSGDSSQKTFTKPETYER